MDEGDLKKARQGSQMQEMREGEVLSLALLPVQEEADGTNKAVQKTNIVAKLIDLEEKQYNFFCAITHYYILYDESYDDTA